MGLILSRFRAKKTTIEILESIDKDINRLQKNRKENQEKQKRIVTSLLIYSIVAYILCAIIFFVYYFPDTWPLRVLYSSPLLVFPVLIWGLKKLLHWYFVKRIASNDGELSKLREQKKQILEDVMETETYKKAKEILEKFDPVRFKKLEALPDAASPNQSSPGRTPGTALHQRVLASRSMSQPSNIRTPMSSTPLRAPVPQPRPRPAPTPMTRTPRPTAPSQPTSARQPLLPQQQQQQHQQQQLQMSAMRQQQAQAMMAGAMPPGPPMPRSVLPQQRGTMDRLMDYLVGDGPENRYALICRQCHSHNGMALKEEFEYLTFRCCYCYYVNPARKQRPTAPRLEFFAPRRVNFDSGRRPSEDESEDEEDSDNSDDEVKKKNIEGSVATPASKTSNKPIAANNATHRIQAVRDVSNNAPARTPSGTKSSASAIPVKTSAVVSNLTSQGPAAGGVKSQQVSSQNKSVTQEAAAAGDSVGGPSKDKIEGKAQLEDAMAGRSDATVSDGGADVIHHGDDDFASSARGEEIPFADDVEKHVDDLADSLTGQEFLLSRGVDKVEEMDVDETTTLVPDLMRCDEVLDGLSSGESQDHIGTSEDSQGSVCDGQDGGDSHMVTKSPLSVTGSNLSSEGQTSESNMN